VVARSNNRSLQQALGVTPSTYQRHGQANGDQGAYSFLLATAHLHGEFPGEPSRSEFGSQIRISSARMVEVVAALRVRLGSLCAAIVASSLHTACEPFNNATYDGSVALPDLQVMEPRPRIAMVLSSGGLRGSAHIGVMRMLEAAGIPIDLEVGSSADSLLWAFWAEGRSAAEVDPLSQEGGPFALFNLSTSLTAEQRERVARRSARARSRPGRPSDPRRAGVRGLTAVPLLPVCTQCR
jgi:hypothetical protein